MTRPILCSLVCILLVSPVAANQAPEASLRATPSTGAPAPAPRRVASQLAALEAIAVDSAAEVIKTAAASGDRSFIPALKRIASARTTPGDDRVCFYALVALLKLGEPESFLYECAEGHARNRTLARTAIAVLARRPTPRLEALLDRLNGDGNDVELARIRFELEMIKAADAELDGFSPEQRAAALCLFAAVLVSDGSATDEADDFVPELSEHWLRTRLRETSAADPASFVRGVLEFSFYDELPVDPRVVVTYVRNSLAPEARALLDRGGR